MSEETKKNDEKDIIKDSVELLQAKLVTLEEAVVEKDALIEELTSKLADATAFIEGDQKKMLLAEIKPKVDIPDEILKIKTIDELKQMKKILDVARVPAFKAGTPIYNDKKPSPRQELDNMFDTNMAKLRGGSKL